MSAGSQNEPTPELPSSESGEAPGNGAGDAGGAGGFDDDDTQEDDDAGGDDDALD